MVDVAIAIQKHAGWLYMLLGVLMARQLHNLWRARRDRATALFGLEREAATGKAVRSMVTLLLLMTIATGVYTLAHVIVPSFPPDVIRPDTSAPIIQTPPTADLPTDTPTPSAATATHPLPLIVTATPEGAWGG